MNKNKIEDILKKVNPPEEIDQTKKQQLRRELLNSDHFKKKKYWEFLFTPKYLLAGVFTVLLLFIVFKIANDAPVTFNDLKQKSNAYYAGLVPSANFASFNNDLTIYGSNQAKVNLNVEQIVDPITSSINIRIFDEKRIEELDELIVKDGRIYRTENPKIKTVGTVSPIYRGNMQVILLDDSAEIPGKLELLIKHRNSPNFTSHSTEFGYLIYEKPLKTDSEIPTYSSKPFYQEIPKEVDVDKYFRTNPIELVDEINTSKTAEYIGDSYDDTSLQKVHIIQMTREIDKDVVKAYKVILRNLDSTRNSNAEFQFADSLTVFDFEGDMDWATNDKDSLNTYRELKTISIASENGEITNVKFAIIKDDIKLNLSEIRFNKQSALPTDTTIFNYKNHGLVFVGNLK